MLTLTAESLRPPRVTSAPVPPPWRAAAIAAYRRAEGEEVETLVAQLVAHVTALTGVTAPVVLVDRGRRQASAAVDGVVFRAQRDELRIVRSCAHCATGEFVSPPIVDAADLGYAIDAWEPHCSFCTPDDQEDRSFSW